MRLFSGMRPTGPLHLGHLVGALRNWVSLQEGYDCFFTIADWHALTTAYADTTKLPGYIMDMALSWRAAGIDFTRSVCFVQSDVKEHAELHLLFSMVTPMPWLERTPSYKEQRAQITTKDLGNVGFFLYPALQAADGLALVASASRKGYRRRANRLTVSSFTVRVGIPINGLICSALYD